MVLIQMPLTLDNEGTYDVLADHHDRNRKPKAPSADRLRHSAIYHRRWPKRVADSDNKIVPDSEAEELENDLEENSQSDDSEGPSRKRTKRNSTRHQPKPTQIQFYLGTWADLLERAKQFFRLWLIKECPFPERDVNLLSAQHVLEKAMEEFEAKDCEVEDGRCKSTCHNIFS